MGYSGEFNPPPTGPTHSNQKVFISRLLNSVFTVKVIQGESPVVT
jgi:hypothetical protein